MNAGAILILLMVICGKTNKEKAEGEGGESSYHVLLYM